MLILKPNPNSNLKPKPTYPTKSNRSFSFKVFSRYTHTHSALTAEHLKVMAGNKHFKEEHKTTEKSIHTKVMISVNCTLHTESIQDWNHMRSFCVCTDYNENYQV